VAAADHHGAAFGEESADRSCLVVLLLRCFSWSAHGDLNGHVRRLSGPGVRDQLPASGTPPKASVLGHLGHLGHPSRDRLGDPYRRLTPVRPRHRLAIGVGEVALVNFSGLRT
jgi:hypothetical protein